MIMMKNKKTDIFIDQGIVEDNMSKLFNQEYQTLINSQKM